MNPRTGLGTTAKFCSGGKHCGTFFAGIRAGSHTKAWSEMKWKQFLSGTAILFYTLLAVVILAFVMKQSDSRIIAKLDAGSATIEAVHPGNGEDLAPGEVNQLILSVARMLRTGSHERLSVLFVAAGQYEIDVYVDNVLAVSYPFGVEKGRNTPARVKVLIGERSRQSVWIRSETS